MLSTAPNIEISSQTRLSYCLFYSISGQSRRDVIATGHRSNGIENPAFEITPADEYDVAMTIDDVAMTIDETAYDSASIQEQSLLERDEDDDDDDDRIDDVRTDL